MKATALFHSDDPVGRNVLQAVHPAARPAKRDFVHRRAAAKTEVGAKIVLRNVTAAAANLVRLPLGAGADLDPRPDPVTVGLAAHGSDLNPVLAVSAVVAQQVSRTVHVVDGDVNVSVVIVVGEGGAAARTCQLNALACGVGNILERAAPGGGWYIPVEQLSLGVGRVDAIGVDLG